MVVRTGAGAAHTLNGLEIPCQIAVKSCERAFFITRLTGVEAEEQNVLAVETQFDGMEVCQRADEQAGGDHE